MAYDFKDSIDFKAFDDTPYDDDIPKEFRAEEPAPPPFDVDFPSWYPYDGAAELIAWAFDQLG